MKHIRYIVCMLAVLLGSMAPLSAQIYDAEGQYVDTIFHDHVNRQAADFVTVSLVVCDPCDVLYSTLGHACLHLECPTFGLDYFFSYESESVRDKVWTFLKGDLKMGMLSLTPEDFLQGYRQEGRGVREYKMNLSPAQKQELWRVMDERVGRGTNLSYDYFHRGCAKSVVKVVKEALGNDAISYAEWPEKYSRQTQREIVRNFITQAPWSEFEMYFLIGIDGDRDYPCEQKLIVPTDLVEVWQEATLDGRPLLEREAHELLPSLPQSGPTQLTPGLLSILLLLLALASCAELIVTNRGVRVAARSIDYLLLTVQTAIGIVMTYLIVFSHLPCTDWNWLLIPFNPLPAIFWRWRRYWALPAAVLLVGWIVAMVAYPHVLVDWQHLTLVAAMAVMLAKCGWLSRNR